MSKNAEFNSFKVVCIDRSITGLNTDIFVPSFDEERSPDENPMLWFATDSGYESIPLLKDYSAYPSIPIPTQNWITENYGLLIKHYRNYFSDKMLLVILDTRKNLANQNYQIIHTVIRSEGLPEYLFNGTEIYYIALKNNRYGLLNFEGSIIIPFEYDNITYTNFNIFRLVKHGKMGLVHFEHDYDKATDTYRDIKIEIPCEYDYISTINACSAFELKKYLLDSSSVKVYLPLVTRLTEEYEHCHYFNEGILELHRTDKRILLDDQTGNVINEDIEYFTCGIYNTAVGFVIQDFKFPHTYRLIFIRNCFEEPDIPDQKRIIDFDGDFSVIFEDDECSYPLIKQFKIVDNDGNTTILNNEGFKIE